MAKGEAAMPETTASARLGKAEPDEPRERECLRCYLGRMLLQHGCDNTRRWTVRWHARRAPDDDQLLDELADRGGICCDCEVVMNVWEATADEETETGPPVPCAGSGSRNPLGLCARWAGWSLRAPGDDYDDEDDYDYDLDYDEM